MSLISILQVLKILMVQGGDSCGYALAWVVRVSDISGGLRHTGFGHVNTILRRIDCRVDSAVYHTAPISNYLNPLQLRLFFTPFFPT